MATTYLSRTQTTPTGDENKKFTLSMWIKRSKLGANQGLYGNTYSATHRAFIYFDSSDRISYYDTSTPSEVTTNRRFRDTSAWYHIVVSVDTTQATASNRVKFYVNGTQETSLFHTTYPSQDQNLKLMNTTNTPNVGRYDNGSGTINYFDGSMAHVHFTQGYTYAASDFGETESTSGIWKPKTSLSVTYGTNGFFLKFQDSSSLGDDSSGNTNDWTLNGSGKQILDTPSNVFATLNPLVNNWSTMTNGNLTVKSTSQAYRASLSTLAVSSGKWYCEVKIDLEVGGTYPVVGIADVTEYGYPTQNNLIGSSTNGYGFYTDGNYYNNNADAGDWTAVTTGDIVGLALDLDSSTKTIKVYKNGTLSTTVTVNDPISAYAFGCSTYQADNVACSWNFGNGYFGTTAVASAENDDAGLGKFEYDVPAGYYALCTKNINNYG